MSLFSQNDVGDSFLRSYKDCLRKKNLAMTEDDMRRVRSAVVTLLRRRSAEDTLCCNDEESLRVKRINRGGFVTALTCDNCHTHVETVCRDVSWNYEQVHDRSQLKIGDHICWHRPYAIWHHAIVTDVHVDAGGEIHVEIIHYSCKMRVEETTMDKDKTCCRCCGHLGEECNLLYRVNYDDCYNSEYTVMRARKLINETRYCSGDYYSSTRSI